MRVIKTMPGDDLSVLLVQNERLTEDLLAKLSKLAAGHNIPATRRARPPEPLEKPASWESVSTAIARNEELLTNIGGLLNRTLGGLQLRISPTGSSPGPSVTVVEPEPEPEPATARAASEILCRVVGR